MLALTLTALMGLWGQCVPREGGAELHLREFSAQTVKVATLVLARADCAKPYRPRFGVIHTWAYRLEGSTLHGTLVSERAAFFEKGWAQEEGLFTCELREWLSETIGCVRDMSEESELVRLAVDYHLVNVRLRIGHGGSLEDGSGVTLERFSLDN